MFVIPLLLIAGALQAQTPTVPPLPMPDLQQQLAPLQGQVLALREPVEGKELQFDVTGARQKGKPGLWTTDSYIHVAEIEVAPDKITLRGKRREAWFVRGEVVPVNDDRGDVKIEILTAPGRTGLGDALHKIFLSSKEKIDISSTKRCWKDAQASAAVPANSPEGRDEKVRAGISAPRPTKTPDPKYSEDARRDHVEGTVILFVKLSAQGRPQEICVVRPLGHGLDQEAIDAVREWRFEPARRGSEPVPVQVNIEVNFRLSMR